MRRVVVPMALEGEGLNENAFIRSSYLSRLMERDAIPVPISPHMPRPMVEALYREADGILLLGGVDFAAEHYGATPHRETKAGPQQRDRFELEWIRRAVANRKPLLGICRGCQGLAIALDGTLRQHIPEDFPNEIHSRPASTDYAEALSLYHPVQLKPHSRIAKICNAETVLMNSAHHQSVAAVGTTLQVTGVSPAGCVEFIEHIDADYFCLGVQAHPEAMPEIHAHAIFDAFVAAL